MAETGDVERNKLEVSQYSKKGFHPGLSKDERWCATNINEQVGVLMEEQKGYASASRFMDYIKGLRDRRDDLNQEIRAKTAGPVLQSLKETFEVVRQVPLHEGNLLSISGVMAEVVVETCGTRPRVQTHQHRYRVFLCSCRRGREPTTPSFIN